jgi:hypothetical protein
MESLGDFEGMNDDLGKNFEEDFGQIDDWDDTKKKSVNKDKIQNRDKTPYKPKKNNDDDIEIDDLDNFDDDFGSLGELDEDEMADSPLKKEREMLRQRFQVRQRR